MAESPRRAWEGCHVEVEFVDERGKTELAAFDLVPERAASIDDGQLSVTSPLGKALLGKLEGSETPWCMGDIRLVRVLRISEAQKEADNEAAERQRAAVEEARRKVERTNEEIFASTFTSKWGGYDVHSD